MGKLKPKTPKAPDTSKQDKALQDQEDRAKKNEERANRELSSAARFAKNRRTGRRLLLAPDRESNRADLSGNTSTGNF